MKSQNDVTFKVWVYRLCCNVIVYSGYELSKLWLHYQMIWNQKYYLIVYQSEYM